MPLVTGRLINQRLEADLSTDDLCEMMDAVAPKPGPRGPYKKRVAENSN